MTKPSPARSKRQRGLRVPQGSNYCRFVKLAEGMGVIIFIHPTKGRLHMVKK